MELLDVLALIIVVAAGLAGVAAWRRQLLVRELRAASPPGAMVRPNDPLAHYNLACSYALLKRGEQALKILRRAVELGYRDFRYMREDRDLDAVRNDPRFRQLLREYENHG